MELSKIKKLSSLLCKSEKKAAVKNAKISLDEYIEYEEKNCFDWRLQNENDKNS